MEVPWKNRDAGRSWLPRGKLARAAWLPPLRPVILPTAARQPAFFLPPFPSQPPLPPLLLLLLLLPLPLLRSSHKVNINNRE